MNRAHLVPTALAFVAGVASDVVGVAVPVLGAVVTLAVLARAASGVVRANGVAALALGMLYARTVAHAPAPAPDAHVMRLPVTVVDARASDGGRTEAVVRLGDGALATLALPGDPPPIGTRLLVAAKRAAFDDARNPGEPSLRAIEAERGIAWHLMHARVVARAPPDTRDASLWIARTRAWASARLHATSANPMRRCWPVRCGANAVGYRPICARSSRTRARCTCS